MAKTCFKCGQAKPMRDFYRHPRMADGRLGKCKICTIEDVKANYRDNIDHYREYERRRFKDEKRKALLLKYQRKRRKMYPEKEHARAAIRAALRTGRLTRQPCEVCGTTEQVQAHHDDYSKPLDVRWLCFKHHREAHGQTVYN